MENWNVRIVQLYVLSILETCIFFLLGNEISVTVIFLYPDEIHDPPNHFLPLGKESRFFYR